MSKPERMLPATTVADAEPADNAQQEKLRLEIAKLTIDTEHQRMENALRLQKLSLEIADLSRSAWTKPATIFPIIAALVTLGFAQFLGVFETASKKLDLQNSEIRLQNREVVLQRTALIDDVRRLEKERKEVADDKLRLEEGRLEISSQLNASKAELEQVRSAEIAARQRAVAAEARGRLAYPAFRYALLQRFAADLVAGCRAAKTVPGDRDFSDGNVYPQAMDTAEVAFPVDIEQCLALKYTQATYLADLLPADKSLLEAELKSTGTELKCTRKDAMAEYGNAARDGFWSKQGQWGYGYRHLESKREGDPAWKDAVRKLAVREYFNAYQANAIKGMLERWPNAAGVVKPKEPPLPDVYQGPSWLRSIPESEMLRRHIKLSLKNC